MSKLTREFAEALLANNRTCLLHKRPMEEYGDADLCGTRPTQCPVCEKERTRPTR